MENIDRILEKLGKLNDINGFFSRKLNAKIILKRFERERYITFQTDLKLLADDELELLYIIKILLGVRMTIGIGENGNIEIMLFDVYSSRKEREKIDDKKSPENLCAWT